MLVCMFWPWKYKNGHFNSQTIQNSLSWPLNYANMYIPKFLANMTSDFIEIYDIYIQLVGQNEQICIVEWLKWKVFIH